MCILYKWMVEIQRKTFCLEKKNPIWVSESAKLARRYPVDRGMKCFPRLG